MSTYDNSKLYNLPFSHKSRKTVLNSEGRKGHILTPVLSNC